MKCKIQNLEWYIKFVERDKIQVVNSNNKGNVMLMVGPWTFLVFRHGHSCIQFEK